MPEKVDTAWASSLASQLPQVTAMTCNTVVRLRGRSLCRDWPHRAHINTWQKP